jgi:hypothetical protein
MEDTSRYPYSLLLYQTKKRLSYSQPDRRSAFVSLRRLIVLKYCPLQCVSFDGLVISAIRENAAFHVNRLRAFPSSHTSIAFRFVLKCQHF